MGHVIVTSRTLLWTLLTVATALSMLAAVITPAWLVGAPKRPLIRGRLSGATDAAAAALQALHRPVQ
ncbi:hypothetical protein MTO96_012698 [Rhipicephalus appendiculatus]